jgi:hypothetical protein
MADQGTQVFDVDNASGTGIGSFNADDTITDILQTHLGDFTVPTSLDAIAGAVTDLLSGASG